MLVLTILCYYVLAYTSYRGGACSSHEELTVVADAQRIMATKSLKAPPAFNEGDDYLSWKNDILVWEMFTDYAAEKRGPAVYLALAGKAREAVREIPAAELGVDGGVKVITDKLDAFYLKDKNTQAYQNFHEFYRYRRGTGDTFNEFIVTFEKLYNKIVKYEMTCAGWCEGVFLVTSCELYRR